MSGGLLDLLSAAAYEVVDEKGVEDERGSSKTVEDDLNIHSHAPSAITPHSPPRPAIPRVSTSTFGTETLPVSWETETIVLDIEASSSNGSGEVGGVKLKAELKSGDEGSGNTSANTSANTNTQQPPLVNSTYSHELLNPPSLGLPASLASILSNAGPYSPDKQSRQLPLPQLPPLPPIHFTHPSYPSSMNLQPVQYQRPPSAAPRPSPVSVPGRAATAPRKRTRAPSNNVSKQASTATLTNTPIVDEHTHTPPVRSKQASTSTLTNTPIIDEHMHTPPVRLSEDSSLIRCICPFDDDDGFTIQCEECYGWLHGLCVSISPESVPETFICPMCDPKVRVGKEDRVRAERVQLLRREEEARLRRERELYGLPPSSSGMTGIESSDPYIPEGYDRLTLTQTGEDGGNGEDELLAQARGIAAQKSLERIPYANTSDGSPPMSHRTRETSKHATSMPVISTVSRIDQSLPPHLQQHPNTLQYQQYLNQTQSSAPQYTQAGASIKSGTFLDDTVHRGVIGISRHNKSASPSAMPDIPPLAERTIPSTSQHTSLSSSTNSRKRKAAPGSFVTSSSFTKDDARMVPGTPGPAMSSQKDANVNGSATTGSAANRRRKSAGQALSASAKLTSAASLALAAVTADAKNVDGPTLPSSGGGGKDPFKTKSRSGGLKDQSTTATPETSSALLSAALPLGATMSRAENGQGQPVTTLNVRDGLLSDDDEFQDETEWKYEAWQYEYTPIDKLRYVNKALEKQIDALVAKFVKEEAENIAVQTQAVSQAGSTKIAASTDGSRDARPTMPAKTPSYDASTRPSALNLSRPPFLSTNGSRLTSPGPSSGSSTPAYSSSGVASALAAPVPPVIIATVNESSMAATAKSRPAVKPIASAALALAPPACMPFSGAIAVTGMMFPYPRPTYHGVFATTSHHAGTFLSFMHGEVVSGQQYRNEPMNQWNEMGMLKPFTRGIAQPWDLVLDQRRWGDETRFIRQGCHPNVHIRPVIIRKTLTTNGRNVQPATNSRANKRAKMAEMGVAARRKDGHDDSTSADADGVNLATGQQYELAFGLYALQDISKREELVLPFDWADDHVVHALHTLLFSPDLVFPKIPDHFRHNADNAASSDSDGVPTTSSYSVLSLSQKAHIARCRKHLYRLSRLAATTCLIFLGTHTCACEKRRDCAISWLWKLGSFSESSNRTRVTKVSLQDFDLNGLEAAVASALSSEDRPLSATVSRSSKSGGKKDKKQGAPKRRRADIGALIGLCRGWEAQPIEAYPALPPLLNSPELDSEEDEPNETVVKVTHTQNRSDDMDVDSPAPVTQPAKQPLQATTQSAAAAEMVQAETFDMQSNIPSFLKNLFIPPSASVASDVKPSAQEFSDGDSSDSDLTVPLPSDGEKGVSESEDEEIVRPPKRKVVNEKQAKRSPVMATMRTSNQLETSQRQASMSRNDKASATPVTSVDRHNEHSLPAPPKTIAAEGRKDAESSHSTAAKTLDPIASSLPLQQLSPGPLLEDLFSAQLPPAPPVPATAAAAAAQDDINRSGASTGAVPDTEELASNTVESVMKTLETDVYAVQTTTDIVLSPRTELLPPPPEPAAPPPRRLSFKAYKQRITAPKPVLSELVISEAAEHADTQAAIVPTGRQEEKRSSFEDVVMSIVDSPVGTPMLEKAEAITPSRLPIEDHTVPAGDHDHEAGTSAIQPNETKTTNPPILAAPAPPPPPRARLSFAAYLQRNKGSPSSNPAQLTPAAGPPSAVLVDAGVEDLARPAADTCDLTSVISTAEVPASDGAADSDIREIKVDASSPHIADIQTESVVAESHSILPQQEEANITVVAVPAADQPTYDIAKSSSPEKITARLPSPFLDLQDFVTPTTRHEEITLESSYLPTAGDGLEPAGGSIDAEEGEVADLEPGEVESASADPSAIVNTEVQPNISEISATLVKLEDESMEPRPMSVEPIQESVSARHHYSPELSETHTIASQRLDAEGYDKEAKTTTEREADIKAHRSPTPERSMPVDESVNLANGKGVWQGSWAADRQRSPPRHYESMNGVPAATPRGNYERPIRPPRAPSPSSIPSGPRNAPTGPRGSSRGGRGRGTGSYTGGRGRDSAYSGGYGSSGPGGLACRSSESSSRPASYNGPSSTGPIRGRYEREPPSGPRALQGRGESRSNASGRPERGRFDGIPSGPASMMTRDQGWGGRGGGSRGRGASGRGNYTRDRDER